MIKRKFYARKKCLSKVIQYFFNIFTNLIIYLKLDFLFWIKKSLKNIIFTWNFKQKYLRKIRELSENLFTKFK